MLQWSWCDIRSQTFEGRPKKQQHRKSHRHFVLCRQEGHLSFNDRVVPVNRKEGCAMGNEKVPPSSIPLLHSQLVVPYSSQGVALAPIYEYSQKIALSTKVAK